MRAQSKLNQAGRRARQTKAGSVPSSPKSIPIKQPFSGQVLDGFFNKSRAGLSKVRTIKPDRPSAAGPASAADVHRRINRSSALMRAFVRKAKTATAHDFDLKKGDYKSSLPVASGWPGPKPDKAKLARAKEVSQHKLVQRFGRSLTTAQRPQTKLAAAPKVLRPTLRPLAATTSRGPGSQSLAKPLPSMLTSASHYRLERLLDWALVHADAHKQSLEDSVRPHRRFWHWLGQLPRLVSIGLPLIVILSLGTVLAYQHLPSLAIRVADWRSGVAATVPSYSPSGFRVAGPPSYQPDQVNLTFRSADGTQSFQISQRASSWDSGSLLASYVKLSDQPYQTTEAGGKTIFTYGATNATWVDHGIWYIIQNNAKLNADQIAKIATSF